MGLDMAEFIMDIEDQFEIRMPNDDYAHITTPGKLIDYLAARLELASGSVPCPTQVAFYTVRQSAMSRLGLDRQAIRPGTRLESLIPRRNRRAAWERLRAGLSRGKWPQLHRSLSVNVILAVISVILGGLVYQGLEKRQGTNLATVVAALAIFASASILHWASIPLAIEFARGYRSFGDLAAFTLGEHRVDNANLPWTREEIAAKVRLLVLTHLGPAEFAYAEDATWSEMGIN